MKDSVIIVTGGGRGIGRAIAERFAAAGAQVVAAARSEAELVDVQKTISTTGGKCAIQAIDVASDDDLDALIETTRDKFGRIDVLVNNAGVAPLGAIEELAPEVFDTLAAVNVRAVYYACRAVWPVMKSQGGGTIINISSIAAFDPFPGFAAYGASKAWVTAWTRGLAEEGREHNIRVVAVGPGAVETRMLRDVFPEFPRTDLIHPSDVANVVFELTQPPWRHVTGQTIIVKK
jgi:NAD(P)-dependent dehydrogenase (short-subunit alcohol dehydrogenase family)